MAEVAAGEGALRSSVIGPGLIDGEVVEQFAGGGPGLSAYAGGGFGAQVTELQLGDEAARVGEVERLDEGPRDLLRPHPPVPASQGAGSRPPQRVHRVPRRDVPPAITLAGQGRDGVGTDMDVVVDAAGEVHARGTGKFGSGTG